MWLIVRWCSRTLEQENFAVKFHVKQVKSWLKCKDFKIRTPILEVGNPLAMIDT